MLRWFFLILLLLNAVLYGWFYQEKERRRAVADRVEERVHGVAGLDLLSEVPDTALRLRETESLVEVTQESVSPAALHCYRFGPFAEPHGLEGWLGDDGAGRLTLEREEVAELPPEYRVSVAAPAAVAQRKALLQSMRVIGLEGEWLSTELLIDRLSVGVFQKPTSAQALEKALLEQGYAATIATQRAFVYRYYLLLRSDFEAVNDSPWVRSLLKKYPAATSEKKLCQRLATVPSHE